MTSFLGRNKATPASFTHSERPAPSGKTAVVRTVEEQEERNEKLALGEWTKVSSIFHDKQNYGLTFLNKGTE